ncbi:MAG: protein kinase [Bdellovibrionota bacterium]
MRLSSCDGIVKAACSFGLCTSKTWFIADLTTSNIMWTKQKLIKIMDFGLAKVIHNLQSEQSIIGGTPSFMSPEQTLGKPADHRTDIYSLGICIFEMCLGTLPFSKGDLGYHHLHTQPPIQKKSIQPFLK